MTESTVKKRTKPKGLKKTGGRVAGTPNKLSAEARAVLAEHKFDALVEMMSLYHEARADNDKAEAGKLITQLIKYQYPQLRAIDVNVENAPNTVFEINMTGYMPGSGDGEDSA